MEFSKRSWTVRETNGKKEGPGANYFSSSPKLVHLNEKGHLVMKIAYIDGKETCSEVFLNESLGYGSYIFHVGKGHDNLSPSAVLGLFTYQLEESAHEDSNKNKEIDIEISTWGDKNNPENTQYVIQPYHKKGNIYRFSSHDVCFENKNKNKNQDKENKSIIKNNSVSIVHAFTWQPEYILFQTYSTDNLDEVYEYVGKERLMNYQNNKEEQKQQNEQQYPSLINQWRYEQKQPIPRPENERVHINFWLYKNNHHNQNEKNDHHHFDNNEQSIEILEFRFKN